MMCFRALLFMRVLNCIMAVGTMHITSIVVEDG